MFDKGLFENMELNCQGYDASIKRIHDDIKTQIVKEEEKQIFQAIQNMGIVVGKEELIKALNYSRNQYSKGYQQGINKLFENIMEQLKE